jgi:hydroxypyruvate isomerase
MDEADSSRPKPAESRAGRIRQTIVHWCFDPYWDVEETCRVARELGCEGIELVEPEHWPILRKYGLACTLARSHPFDKGMNDPRHWPMCFDRIRTAIDHCADFGFPNVVTLTGLRDGIPDDVGLRNCVEGYRQIVPYAERKNVTLCLEIINSRADTFMHGRPGYQGDHADYCLEIVRQVDSPRFKFLFDIYHVQVMDGDLITRIRQSAELIGHYHTAGNPGRRELDDRQEINYPAIMRAILETGYTGFVGQEFIPTRDPREGLAEAVRLCDVGITG